MQKKSYLCSVNWMIMRAKEKKSIVAKALLAVILMVGWSVSAAAEDVIYISTDQFRQRVFDYRAVNGKAPEWKYLGDKPCVIDFYTTWCGPCKRLAPIMEELSQQYCGEVVFYKADTERERELAYVFGINSIPQVLYVPMSGKPILLQGLYPKENIVRIIEEFLLPSVKEAEQKPTVSEPQPAQPEKKKSWWQRWKEKRKAKKEK